MKLDGRLYRKYYKELGEWKEREAVEQALSRRDITPQQAWEDYMVLWELAMMFAPKNDEYAHAEHIRYWEDYYLNIQKLQAWMKANGKEA